MTTLLRAFHEQQLCKHLDTLLDLIDLKLIWNTTSIAIVLSVVSGQVWNSILRIPDRNLEYIYPNHNGQFFIETIFVLIIHSLLMGSLVMIQECLKPPAELNFPYKQTLMRSIVIFILAFFTLNYIIRIKDPYYLRGYQV